MDVHTILVLAGSASMVLLSAASFLRALAKVIQALKE